MKKAIILMSLILSALAPLNAQVYKTGFDTPAEQNGWQQYRLGAMSQFYEWEFSQSGNPVSPPYVLSHNYPVGGTSVTDDWFVSPAFDFSNGGSIDSLSYKFAGFGTPVTADTVAVYLLNGSSDPTLASSVQLLKIYVGADYNNDNTWRNDSNILISNISGQSYIAFRYKTIVNWLDVQFDNLVITAKFPVFVQDKYLDTRVQLYPNPIHGFFKIKAQNGIKISQVKLYDMQGREIEIPIENGICSTGKEKGLRALKIITNKGIIHRTVILQ